MSKISKHLYIEESDYMDFEQVKYDFAECVKENLEAVIEYRKLVGDPEQCAQIVLNEKDENPGSLVYRVTVNRQYNECMQLVYALKQGKLMTEPIRMTREFFKFKHESFKSFPQLLDFFKTKGYLDSKIGLHMRPVPKMQTDSEIKEQSQILGIERPRFLSFLSDPLVCK